MAFGRIRRSDASGESSHGFRPAYIGFVLVAGGVAGPCLFRRDRNPASALSGAAGDGAPGIPGDLCRRGLVAFHADEGFFAPHIPETLVAPLAALNAPHGIRSPEMRMSHDDGVAQPAKRDWAAIAHL